jgi:hypothetical protein
MTTSRTTDAPASPASAAPAAKRAPKAAAKPTPAKAAPPAAPAKDAAKDTKPKKPKLVRDSFTIPKDEYAAIEALKLRTGTLGAAAKKSELLRAGLKLLAGLPDAGLLQALQAVPALKTGRPKAEQAPAPAKKAKPRK